MSSDDPRRQKRKIRAQLRAFVEEVIQKELAASKRSRDEIEREFREKATQVHPDVGGDAAAFRQAVEDREVALAKVGSFEVTWITSEELWDLASSLRPDHVFTWRELRLAVIRKYGLSEDDAKRLIAGFSRARHSYRWRFFVDRKHGDRQPEIKSVAEPWRPRERRQANVSRPAARAQQKGRAWTPSPHVVGSERTLTRSSGGTKATLPVNQITVTDRG